MNMKRKFEDELDNLSPSLKRMRMIEEDGDTELDRVHHGRQPLVCLPGEMTNRIYNADSNKKRRFEDALHDLSPSLKRSNAMAEDEDTDMDHVHVQKTRQPFDFLTRIPGEIRNRIYDAFLAETLPQSDFVEPNILMTRWTSSDDDDDVLTVHESLRREKARRQQEPYLSAIRTTALRCVPGVRKEFMSRLWHAVTLRFTTLRPHSPLQACDFSFLRSVHPGTILYQVELEEIELSHKDRTKMMELFLPFLRALEDMKFKGTVRLLGRQDDVELAWCCIDRMQKYWRLGNSLMEVRNNMDGVWRMMSDIRKCPIYYVVP